MGTRLGVISAPTGSIGYRLVVYRPTVVIVFAGLGLLAIGLALNFLSGGPGPGPGFLVLWLAIGVWCGYWFLFRVAYEVGVVDGSIVRWRSIAARHEVSLAKVRGIRSWLPPLGTGVKRIAVDGDRSPLIMVSAGFSDVVSMLTQFRPDLVVQIGRYDALAESAAFPRSWGWRRL